MAVPAAAVMAAVAAAAVGAAVEAAAAAVAAADSAALAYLQRDLDVHGTQAGAVQLRTTMIRHHLKCTVILHGNTAKTLHFLVATLLISKNTFGA